MPSLFVVALFELILNAIDVRFKAIHVDYIQIFDIEAPNLLKWCQKEHFANLRAQELNCVLPIASLKDCGGLGTFQLPLHWFRTKAPN